MIWTRRRVRERMSARARPLVRPGAPDAAAAAQRDASIGSGAQATAVRDASIGSGAQATAVRDAVRREAVFHARGLTKTYHMGDVDVPALRSIDLDLYPGELVVILGASGSGKSTLLNILGGLDKPTSGAVRFRDHELSEADADGLTLFRRERVGFVFQF